MQADVSKAGGKAFIRLTGRFDFNTHREFRSAYEHIVADPEVREIAVDFAAVDYLDSSALGMLLMLRDKAINGGKAVSLCNVSGNVKQVMDIANFGKLFRIS